MSGQRIDDGTVGPANHPPSGGLSGDTPSPSGAPFGQSPPIVPPIPPPFTPPPVLFADLNAAKRLAAANASAAVTLLAQVMADTELYDTEVRVNAAAELLQFLTKGPF